MPLYEDDDSDTYKGTNTRVEHVFGSGPVRSLKGFDEVFIGGQGGMQGPTVQSMDFWFNVSFGFSDQHYMPPIAMLTSLTGKRPTFKEKTKEDPQNEI